MNFTFLYTNSWVHEDGKSVSHLCNPRSWGSVSTRRMTEWLSEAVGGLGLRTLCFLVLCLVTEVPQGRQHHNDSGGRGHPAINSSWDFGLDSAANNRKSKIIVALTHNGLIFSNAFSQSELIHVTSSQIFKKTEHYPETLLRLPPDTSPTQGWLLYWSLTHRSVLSAFVLY